MVAHVRLVAVSVAGEDIRRRPLHILNIQIPIPISDPVARNVIGGVRILVPLIRCLGGSGSTADEAPVVTVGVNLGALDVADIELIVFEILVGSILLLYLRLNQPRERILLIPISRHRHLHAAATPSPAPTTWLIRGSLLIVPLVVAVLILLPFVVILILGYLLRLLLIPLLIQPLDILKNLKIVALVPVVVRADVVCGGGAGVAFFEESPLILLPLIILIPLILIFLIHFFILFI